ncbi:hypothetical protein COB52_04665 [Candidatus Kaiserbacteria bacterium]|nr:MAG: hypothetical protein COB52_04665 [Candidatus Kaiserbacteria bacterium]
MSVKALFFAITLSFLSLSPAARAEIDYDEDGISIVEDQQYESGVSREASQKLRRKRARRKRSKRRLKNKRRKKSSRANRRRKIRKKRTRSEAGFDRIIEEQFSGNRRESPEKDSVEFSWDRYSEVSEFLGTKRRFVLQPGEFGGELQFEGRAFQEVDGKNATSDGAAGIFARAEIPFESDSEIWAAKIKAFARVDALDSDRNKIFPEDIWLSYSRDFIQLRVGFQVFNWSQLDLFTPAELLNSVNFDSEIENLEKIGEAAVTLKMKLAFGFLELVYMPFVLGPSFPGAKSRFNLLDPGESMGDPVFVKKDGTLVEKSQFHQFAARFSRTIGRADLSLFFVDQIDRRTPEIVFQNSSQSFRPVFFPIASLGFSMVWSLESFIFKAESLRRLVTNPVQPTIFGTLKKKSHSFGAVGVEREMDLWGGALTTFVEYQKLFGISDESSEIDRQKISSFQNDIAFGFRVNFNDVQAKEVRLLIDVDLDVSEQVLASLSYSQRLWTNWKIKLGVRYINAPKQQQIAIGLEQFDKDNYGFLQLSRFF